MKPLSSCKDQNLQLFFHIVRLYLFSNKLRQEILYFSTLVCVDLCACEIQALSLWHNPTLKRPWNRWRSDTHHLRMISVNFGTLTYLKAQSGRSDLIHGKAILRRSTAAPLRCPHFWGIHFTKEGKMRHEKNHLLILCKCIIHFSLLSCDKNGWFLLRGLVFYTVLHTSPLSVKASSSELMDNKCRVISERDWNLGLFGIPVK